MEPPSFTRARTPSLSFNLPPEPSSAEKAARSVFNSDSSDLMLDKYPKIDPNRIQTRAGSFESDSKVHSQSTPELPPLVVNPFRVRAQSLRSLPFEKQNDCLFFKEIFTKKKRPAPDSFSLIQEMLSLEIEETAQVGSLFRLDSSSAKLLNFWLRSTQREWYKKVCPKEFLRELSSPDYSSVRCLEMLLDQIVRSFETSPEILNLLKSVRQEAEEKFGDQLPPNFIYSFLFLRLINPCIWNPSLFGLPAYKGHPADVSPPRSVIDFVKLLQNQASEPLSEGHEAAESFNPRRESLIAYLQALT